MSTSLWDGLVEFPDLNEEEPADTYLSRTIFNNTLHLADESARVLYNWVDHQSGSSSGIDRDDLYGDPTTGLLGDGDWGEYLHTPTYFAFVRTDGSLYRFVVRLAGRKENVQSNSASVAFEVTVQFPIKGEEPRELAPDSTQYTTSSTTSAWLSPSGGSFLIEASATDTFKAAKEEPTEDTGGTKIGVSVLPVKFIVFAKTGNATAAKPRLTGLHIHEYIG